MTKQPTLRSKTYFIDYKTLAEQLGLKGDVKWTSRANHKGKDGIDIEIAKYEAEELDKITKEIEQLDVTNV